MCGQVPADDRQDARHGGGGDHGEGLDGAAHQVSKILIHYNSELEIYLYFIRIFFVWAKLIIGVQPIYIIII